MTVTDPPLEPTDSKGLPNPTEWLTLDEFLDPAVDPSLPADQRQPLTSERDWTIGEGLGAAFDRFSLIDLVPYAWTVRDAQDLRKLHTAADDYELGIADADQVGLLMRTLGESSDRPDGMAQVAQIAGSVFRDIPAFAGEIAVGGAVAGGARRALSIAGKAGAQRAAREVAERGVLGRLRDGAIRGLEVAAVETAVGQVTGGGRLNVELLSRTLRGMGIEENEAGELALVMEATKPGLLDALPAAIAQTIIEPISEASGGALMKLAPLERLGALQAALARRAFGKGYSVRTLSNRIAELGAWNGLIGEMAEEGYGDVLRTAVGAAIGDKEMQQSLLYEWEEIAGMMVGFGAMSGVGVASDVVEIRRAYRKDQAAAEGGIPDWARETQPDDPEVFGVDAGAARGEMPEEGARIKVQTEEGLQEVEVVSAVAIERDQTAVDMGRGPAREGVLWVRPVKPVQPMEAGTDAEAPRRPAGSESDPRAGQRRDLPPEPMGEAERRLHVATFAAANNAPEGGIVWPDEQQQAQVDFWAEKGVDIIFADVGKNPTYQAVNPRQGVVVVSARAPMEGPASIPRLLAHEMVHEIAKVDIAAFDRLEALVRRFGGTEDLQRNREAARLDMEAAGLPAEAATDQRLREESLAYRAQDLWNTITALRFDDKVELLRELQGIEENRGIFQRIPGWIRQMVRSLGIRLPDRTEEILRQLGVDAAEVGAGTSDNRTASGSLQLSIRPRDTAQARQVTLQAAALAEAMEVVLTGRPTPTAVDAAMARQAGEADAATMALAQDLVAGAAQGDAAARVLAGQILEAAAQGLAVAPAAPAEEVRESPPAEVDASKAPESTGSEEPPTAPAPDKARLIPTRGPDGGVVWTVEPVETPTLGAEPETEPEPEPEVAEVLSEPLPEQPATGTGPTIDDEAGFVRLFAEALLDGEDLGNALKVREWLKGPLGFYPGLREFIAGRTAKQMEESFEQAVVLAAREIVAKAPTPRQAFAGLVGLYERQPRLATRTSKSAMQQAYSTPAPLAYIASRLGRISEGARVFEPTAGNGMLLIEVDPGVATVNELDPARAEALRGQGFRVTEEDATEIEVPEGRYDRIIENPPFGKLRTAEGKVRRWKELGFRTDQIDHAIALRSLQGLAPDGRAVLIIGGQQVMSTKEKATAEERLALYQQQKPWGFLKTLHRNFNVVDHFQVSGRLYERQGAAWPVDVIVIDGRNTTGAERDDLPPPAYLEPPRILTDWAAIGDLLDEADSLVAPADSRGGRSGPGPAAESRGGDVGPVSESPGGPGAEDDPQGVGPAGTPEPVPDGPAGGGAAGESAGAIDPRGPGLDPSEPGSVPGLAAGSDVQSDGREGALEQPRAAELAGPVRADGGAESLAVDESKLTEGSQVKHAPRSRGRSVDTLLPAQLARPINEALDQLEYEVGDVDLYVARKLQIPRERLADWSAEQIEAMAQAMHQIDQRKGYIIGDQTGVGKGRFVAGLIQYAMRQGLTPVFVTAKPGLFGDMFRDLYDTGVLESLREIQGPETTDFRPYVTHNQAALRSKDEDGNTVGVILPPKPGEVGSPELKAPTPKEHKRVEKHVLEHGRLPEGYHALFTTYDQLKPVAGSEKERHRVVRRLMPGAFLLLDESHVAGGDPMAGSGWATKADEADATLASFAREMVGQAHSVVYSSATWAKTPTAFGLYSKTDLGQIAAQLEQIKPDDIVPILSLVSRGLARAGQMTRREKSFDGISMRPAVADVDMGLAEEMTAGLRAIYDFDLELTDWRKEQVKGMIRSGRGTRDAGIGEGSARATSFGSVLHNVVGQMIFAIKAKGAVDAAREALARGEKVVLTVGQTMGAMLNDYTSSSGIGVGDEFGMSFALVFQKYLRRILRVTVKDEHGALTYVDLFDKLPADLRARFDEVSQQIKDLAIGDLPASPIDYMKAELTGAKVKGKRRGARVDEITGRAVVAEYLGPGKYRLAERANGPGPKTRAMQAFNQGDLDVLVINRSGSTGFSLHASEKFKDQSPRHMIVVQAEADVNDVMQMLGRINRTGQVQLPLYTLLATPLPAEQRPLANLMRKLAGLNANTSAGRKGSMDIEAVDFMNYYGDRVVASMLDEDPELSYDVFGDKPPSEIDDLASKFTGKLVILPIDRQREVLQEIEDRYAQAIEQADAKGTNKLRAARRKVTGAPLNRMEFKRASGNGVFQGEVWADEYEMEVPRIPLSRERLDQMIALSRERLDQMIAEARTRWPEMEAALNERGEALDRYGKELVATRERLLRDLREADAADPSERLQRIERIEKQLRRTSQSDASAKDFAATLDAVREYVTGRPFYATQEGHTVPLVGPLGAVLEVRLRKTGRNPAVQSSIQLRVLNLESGRASWVPATRLAAAMGLDTGLYAPRVGGPMSPSDKQIDAYLEQRASQPLTARQWFLTGNLVDGYVEGGDSVEGLVLLERPDGQLTEAVLMSPTWQPNAALAQRPVVVPPKAVAPWLGTEMAQLPGAYLKSPDGVFTVAPSGQEATIAVQSRGGRALYTSPLLIAAVGGEGLVRARSGKAYTATVSHEVAGRVAEIAQGLGFNLAVEGVGREVARDWVETQTFAVPRRRQVFTGFHMADESRIDYLRRKFVRSFERVHRLQKHITGEGGRVSEASDTVLGERLMHGRTRARLAELDANYVQRIRQRMIDSQIPLEEVDRYLYARHAPSRNAVIAERQRARGVEEPNLAGSGMTDAEAVQILAAAHASPAADSLRAIGRLVDEMMEQSLERGVTYGLIAEKERQRLLEQWRHYVPLRTTMDSRTADLSGLGRALGVGNKEYHRAEGRASLADSPLAHAVLQAQRTILRGERNRVGLTFLRMLRENADYVDFREKGVTEQIDEESGEPRGLVEWQLEDVEGALYLKEEGRVIQIQMADALLVRAMKRLGDAAIPEWLRPIQSAMRLFAKMVTQWDPEFLLRNAQRDWAQGLLHLEGEFAGISRRAWSPKSWYSAMRALVAYYKDPGQEPTAETPRWHRLAWELAREGGLPGFFGMRDLEQTIAELVKQVEAASRDSKPKAVARAIAKFMERESNAIEGAMRLVAYEALLGYGISQKRAAGFAKELTVNFDQRGELGAGINAAYLFFNAATQGIYRSIAGIVRSKRMRRLTLGTLVFGAVNGAMQRLIGGDDEETGIPFYDLRAPWEKDTRLIFMIPGTGSAITIPMPYVYNVFYRAGDHIAAVAMGATTPRQAISQGWSLLLSNVNPFGSEATLAQNVSPTILDPFVQAIENQTWSGRPIYPVPFTDRSSTPDSELVWDRNRGDLFHRVARGLSWATLGDEVEGGWIDISPEVLRNTVEFLGGGVGKLAVRGYTEGRAAFTDDPVDWGNVPLVRVAYAGAEGTQKGVQSLFYRLTKETANAELRVKRALDRGDEARAAALEERYSVELDLRREAAAARKRVQALQGQIDEVTDGAERRELTEMAREEMRAFLALAHEMGMR